MLRMIYFFFFLFFPLIAISQSLDFPTENAIWRYSYQDNKGTNEINTFSLIGDSLYNNFQYQKISHPPSIWNGMERLA